MNSWAGRFQAPVSLLSSPRVRRCDLFSLAFVISHWFVFHSQVLKCCHLFQCSFVFNFLSIFHPLVVCMTETYELFSFVKKDNICEVVY